MIFFFLYRQIAKKKFKLNPRCSGPAPACFGASPASASPPHPRGLGPSALPAAPVPHRSRRPRSVPRHDPGGSESTAGNFGHPPPAELFPRPGPIRPRERAPHPPDPPPPSAPWGGGHGGEDALGTGSERHGETKLMEERRQTASAQPEGHRPHRLSWVEGRIFPAHAATAEPSRPARPWAPGRPVAERRSRLGLSARSQPPRPGPEPEGPTVSPASAPPSIPVSFSSGSVEANRWFPLSHPVRPRA